MKWRLGYFLVILGLLGVTGGIYYLKEDSTSRRKSHDSIELTAEQKEEVVNSDGDLVSLYRFKDSDGLWQIGFHPRKSGLDSTFVGNLYRKAVPSEVETPVYLCSYPGSNGANLSLDTHKNCSGEGRRVSSHPAGFLSEKVRTGFRLIARCLNHRHGMYISSRLTCEEKEDRLLASLGSAQFLN